MVTLIFILGFGVLILAHVLIVVSLDAGWETRAGALIGSAMFLDALVLVTLIWRAA